jgi:outer membrane protein insertion porin family
MRYRLAQFIISAAAFLLAANGQVSAQATPEIQVRTSCPSISDSHDKQSFGPEISVAAVAFSGFLRMPVSSQDEIAASIKERTYRTVSSDEVLEEALEIARTHWQHRGYFKVQANGYATDLDSTSSRRRILLSVHVDEGLQYRLGRITFKNNRAVSNVQALRSLFPIKEGEIFSREKIATGLRNLDIAYGELGYINFTSIPDTRFDDEKQLIYLDIDIDEGKQFYVNEINILGVGEPVRAQLLRDFFIKPGQIYNQRLVQLTMQKHQSMFHNCECNDRPVLDLDERTGTVTLTFDARTCLTAAR